VTTEGSHRGAAAGWTANNRIGALWMLAGTISVSVQSAVVKDLGATIDAFEIGFFRGLFGVLIVLPFAMRRVRLRDATRRIALHTGRALAGTSAMICSFYALTSMPLTDAMAIMFTMPLFMILLAVPLLGETVGWRRAAATLIGFVGVVIIVRPGATTFDPASLVALLGALLSAVVGVFIKKLSRIEPAELIMLYFSVFAVVVFAVPAIYVWHAPTLLELALLVAMTVLGIANQLCFIAACRVGEVTVLAPIDYSRLLFAGLLGYFLFGEIPQTSAWLGAAIIGASGFFIVRRTTVLRRAEGPNPRIKNGRP